MVLYSSITDRLNIFAPGVFLVVNCDRNSPKAKSIIQRGKETSLNLQIHSIRFETIGTSQNVGSTLVSLGVPNRRT